MCIFSQRFCCFIWFVHVISLGLPVLIRLGLLLCIGFEGHLNKQMKSNWRTAWLFSWTWVNRAQFSVISPDGTPLLHCLTLEEQSTPNPLDSHLAASPMKNCMTVSEITLARLLGKLNAHRKFRASWSKVEGQSIETASIWALFEQKLWELTAKEN